MTATTKPPTNSHSVSPPASPKETQPKKGTKKTAATASGNTTNTKKRSSGSSKASGSSSKRTKQATTTTTTATNNKNKSPSPPLPDSLVKATKNGNSQANQNLVNIMVKLNTFYQDHMKEPPPFMTFVLVGMQSSGKSTFMERMINLPLNIIQQGTGSRCPLDIICSNDGANADIHASISGKELNNGEKEVHAELSNLFARIMEHMQNLAEADRFSSEPLRLTIKRQDVKPCRVVDLPGIISNKSTGQIDRRQEIKDMIRSIMVDPKARLCVVLEATEYDKNPIINFLDESFDGNRQAWIGKAMFFMPKFDKVLEDTRTVQRANDFFAKFEQNDIFPHPIITPTLDHEDLPPHELYEARKKNLEKAGSLENEQFTTWIQGQYAAAKARGNDPGIRLNKRIAERLGFPTAHETMFQELLANIRSSLPAVESRLKRDMTKFAKERATLVKQHKLNDPDEIKTKIPDLLAFLEIHINNCLDGEFSEVNNFREKCQTLQQEIDEEKQSDWVDKSLNFRSDSESEWRKDVAKVTFDSRIAGQTGLLGKCQVYRATESFRQIMIERLPQTASELVQNAKSMGYGHDAATQVSKCLFQESARPGVNVLVKHVGNIFRRIFAASLDDANKGYELSSEFRAIPQSVKNHLTSCFEQMLWELLTSAAKQIHNSIEPLCHKLYQDLPKGGTSAAAAKSVSTEMEDDVAGNAEKDDDDEKNLDEELKVMKRCLLDADEKRAASKEFIFEDNRASIMTDAEAFEVASKAFKYLRALMDNTGLYFRQQVDAHLNNAFKKSLKECFYRFASESDWEKILSPDPAAKKRIIELDQTYQKLDESLQEVRKLLQSRVDK